MAATAPALLRAWRADAPVARPTARWIAASWALGFYALIPSFLRHWGAPEAICGGWWMNLFVLHPLLERLGHRGPIWGGAALTACYILQYGVALLALRRARTPTLAQAKCLSENQRTRRTRQTEPAEDPTAPGSAGAGRRPQ